MSETRRITSASPYEEQFGFCRALRIGDRIEVAGTAPIGPDGKTVGVGDPAAQARRCFEIMIEAIEQLGGSARDVVRTRMFLTHIEDWEAVGRVHGEFFAEIKPVATMIGIGKLIDPDWRVEFEAEALLRDGAEG
ncbi:endoribonuclease L-PSP [Acidobacteria bacterium Mor1]|nr:endoribonuclease L-PSP [Acidobacteria bacterium Mor1]